MPLRLGIVGYSHTLFCLVNGLLASQLYNGDVELFRTFNENRSCPRKISYELHVWLGRAVKQSPPFQGAVHSYSHEGIDLHNS